MWPRKIICLTSEMTELVFALGAGDRIVGVSGYSVRPPAARQKEKVAAFTSIRLDKIRVLKPDLVLGFSDLQKDIARDLVAEGFHVFISNQRTLEEIGDVILAVGRLIGCEKKAKQIHKKFFQELDQLSLNVKKGAEKPRVYFEEWDEPMISGISWVSGLIERLGGIDIFRDKSSGKTASQRYVSSDEVIAANPDIILASWCGKKVRPEKIMARPGWDQIKAVHENRIYEIKSSDILAPGLSLLHGARQIAEIFRSYRRLFQLTVLPKKATLQPLCQPKRSS